MGELTLLDIFHPGAIYTDGSLMLCLAGHGAGMAADALSIVDNEPEIQSSSSSSDVLVCVVKVIASI
jgi:hypothetical protein